MLTVKIINNNIGADVRNKPVRLRIYTEFSCFFPVDIMGI